jgi:septum formation protein
MRIILASGSARRSQILKENLQLVFEVIPSTFAEDIDKSTCNGPSDYVSQTCRAKCLDSIDKNCSPDNKENWPNIIISADTIVVYDQKILEKPASTQHAIDMLKMLLGKKHTVLTAVTIAVKSNENKSDIISNYNIKTFYETTEGNLLQYYHYY